MSDTIRFRAPGSSHTDVHRALEKLAIAIAEADTDDVEGFQFDMTGPISISGGKIGQRPSESFCIGYKIHPGDKTSCIVEWM